MLNDVMKFLFCGDLNPETKKSNNKAGYYTAEIRGLHFFNSSMEFVNVC